MIIHSVTITQLDLYLQCTNDSFSLTLFIQPYHPDNHLSIPLTLTFSHTLAPGQPPLLHSPFLTTWPQHSDFVSSILFLIGLCGDESKATGLFDWIIQGNPRETPPTLYVHSKTRVSNFHSLACMLHQTKTCLNRHFRCAGAFLTLDSPCRELLETATCADKVLVIYFRETLGDNEFDFLQIV